MPTDINGWIYAILISLIPGGVASYIVGYFFMKKADAHNKIVLDQLNRRLDAQDRMHSKQLSRSEDGYYVEPARDESGQPTGGLAHRQMIGEALELNEALSMKVIKRKASK